MTSFPWPVDCPDDFWSEVKDGTYRAAHGKADLHRVRIPKGFLWSLRRRGALLHSWSSEDHEETPPFQEFYLYVRADVQAEQERVDAMLKRLDELKSDRPWDEYLPGSKDFNPYLAEAPMNRADWALALDWFADILGDDYHKAFRAALPDGDHYA